MWGEARRRASDVRCRQCEAPRWRAWASRRACGCECQTQSSCGCISACPSHEAAPRPLAPVLSDGPLCGGVRYVVLAAIQRERRAQSAGLFDHDIDGAVCAKSFSHGAVRCGGAVVWEYLLACLAISDPRASRGRYGDLLAGTFCSGKLRKPETVPGNIRAPSCVRTAQFRRRAIGAPARWPQRSPRRSSASASTSPRSRASHRAPRRSPRPHCAPSRPRSARMRCGALLAPVHNCCPLALRPLAVFFR